MLDGESPWRLHFAQNASLALLSLFFLPIDSFILIFAYAFHVLSPQNAARRSIRRSPGFQPRTILVTGVAMSKGLVLARAFYQAGHNVIGADVERFGIPVCGRFSRAVKKYYALPDPTETDGALYYVHDLLRIVRREKVDLWVSCSGVASAVEDGEAMEFIEKRSDCKAFQFDVKTTATLHEKHSFIQHTMSLGLPAPETYDVTSRTTVHKILNRTKEKKYIMKSVGQDDARRGDMTLLPQRTISATYQHLARIPISEQKPWVLQQFIKGEEYCTHAVVVRGEVKAFVACPSLDLLMHYKALPPTSSLSTAMLKFTSEFAARSGQHMTGHLSFDFLVQETVTEKGFEKTLYPIECNPRAHTAVVLFNAQSEELAQAYLTAVAPEMNGAGNGHPTEIVIPRQPAAYYWIGHDVVSLVLQPLLHVLMFRLSVADSIRDCYTFLQHVLFWKDGTFEMSDPLPWWWLYHVYWPGTFISCIMTRRKWSRINVSTGRIWDC